MDPMTWAILGGMGVNALGSLWGASSEADANKQNLQFLMAKNNQIQSYVNQMMQPGMNPFAQAMLNFVGQGLPSAVSSFNPTGQNVGNGGNGGGYTGGQAAPNPNGNGADSGTGTQSGGNGTDYNMVSNSPGMFSAAQAGSSSYPTPNIPGYTAGWTPTYGSFAGTDLTGYLGQGLRIQDLVNQGVLTQAQVNQQFGMPADYNPATDPNTQRNYQEYLQQLKATPNGVTPNGLPSFDQWYGQLGGLGSTNLDSFLANDPAAYQQAVNGLPQRPNGGYYDASGQYIPPSTQQQYLQNGMYLDANGQITGYQGANGMQDAPYNPGGLNGGSGGAGGYGASGMVQYTPSQGQTYNPTLLGNAPQVGNLPQLSAQQITAPNASLGQPLFSPEQVKAPTIGSQGMNVGQDALMQMMRANVTPASSPDLSLQLQQLGQGNSQYNTTDLFGALHNSAMQNLDEQVAQLQGSAGSLGQRFGTAMMNTESRMRSNAMNQLNLNEQQIGMQAFENAQGRRQPALNLQADLLNQQNQVNLGNQSNQINAATNLGGQLMNTDLQNAQLGLQAGLANQSAGLQAGLSGQQTLADLAKFNAGNQLSASQGNANLGLQAQQGNLNAFLQAALANQGTQAQFQTNNANISNQANQFNAQMRQNANQFNAQQGNIYNNLVMQALSQAGSMQQAQSGYNASLLGILGGLSVPQTQASPWASAVGNLGNQAMLIPFLNQMYTSNQTK